jgi:hypothetical protein
MKRFSAPRLRADIDRNGIAYVPLSIGHLGTFDQQLQRPAQRPAGRRRQAVSGRLDADAVPGPAVP